MSKNKSRDRQFMRRTMFICIIAIIFFSILIALMVTRFGPFGPFLDFLGPVVTGVFAILLLTLMYIGLLVFFGNLREWYGETAGWFEVVILLVLIIVIGFLGFGWLAALLTGLLCIGVIYYIHISQS